MSRDAWRDALAAAKALALTASTLNADDSETIATLKHALRSAEDEGAALILLGYLDAGFTISLVNQVVEASLSHRHALRARELLGRLPHGEASRVVPPAVLRQLEETGDYDAYRRLAEVLSHLGLADALRDLSNRALESSDPDVREVGQDFAC